MYKKNNPQTVLCIFLLCFLGSCTDSDNKRLSHPLLSHRIQAMESFNLAFAPLANVDSLLDEDGWARADAGRLVTRTFAIPTFQNLPEITLNLTLQSSGDPWDKSGAVVLLPANWSDDIAQDTSKWPGIRGNTDTGFTPALELLRFITPFGVGHFSQSVRSDEYRPVYIPAWEEEITWQGDISHLWSAMSDSITLGVYIDTWSSEGFELDLDIEFREGPRQIPPLQQRRHLTLLNTTKFHADQEAFDGFSEVPLKLECSFPEAAENAVLHYLATGHGGHSIGDEFVRCEHVITLNDDTVAQFTPWRDDCASFRRFNPSSGVWTERTFWKGDSIDERIASSDYSRSGWCPGSAIPALEFNLGNLDAGRHQFTIDIPTAQAYTDTEMNFWNVAAYLTWDGPEED